MRFEKGKSGNPGGRPKGDGEIRELARKHTATALATLVQIAEGGENESARVAAANAILDRGWGKPAVPLVSDGPPPMITINFGRDLQPPADGGDALTVGVALPPPYLAAGLDCLAED
jgi:hypothetical protein